MQMVTFLSYMANAFTRKTALYSYAGIELVSGNRAEAE
jgi:hypothetical protein